MPEAAIHITDLHHRYAGRKSESLTSINLEINRGERFGLFGPNGAGKSTLMHCMTGLLPLSPGTIKLHGLDLTKNKKQAKKLIGFVPQDLALYEELTALENLQYFGAMAGVEKNNIGRKISDLFEELEISGFQHKPLRTLSGGMKRRINLAIGVIHEPAILFLDEPTVGVDVHSRKTIIAYLLSLNKKNTTLIYTSHQLNEAEELCTRVALLHNGKIIAINELDRLLSENNEKNLEGLFLKLTGSAYLIPDV